MKKKYFFLMSLFLFALPKMAFLAESGEEVVESMIINHRHSDYADVFAGSNKPSVTLKTPRDISKAGDRLEKIIKSNMKRQKMNSVVKRQLALALPLYKESLNDSCGCFFKPDADIVEPLQRIFDPNDRKTLRLHYQLVDEKNIEELAWENFWPETKPLVKDWLGRLTTEELKKIREKTVKIASKNSHSVSKKLLQTLLDNEALQENLDKNFAGEGAEKETEKVKSESDWNFSPLVPANFCGYSVAVVGMFTFLSAYNRAKNEISFIQRYQKTVSPFKMALKHLFLFPETFSMQESKGAILTWLLCAAWIAGKVPPLNKTFWNQAVELPS